MHQLLVARPASHRAHTHAAFWTAVNCHSKSPLKVVPSNTCLQPNEYFTMLGAEGSEILSSDGFAYEFVPEWGRRCFRSFELRRRFFPRQWLSEAATYRAYPASAARHLLRSH